MSGKMARDKGNNEERAIVNLHRDYGIHAERTLEKGARSDGSSTWDIDLYVYGQDEAPIIGECKCQQKIGNYIWEWLGDNDFLTLRKNRKERLYVISEQNWLRMMLELKRR